MKFNIGFFDSGGGGEAASIASAVSEAFVSVGEDDVVETSDGVYIKQFEINFVTEASQDWSSHSTGSATAVTVAGLSASASISAAPTTWGITSNGLEMTRSGSSVGTLTFDLSDMINSFDVNVMNVIALASFSHTFNSNSNAYGELALLDSTTNTHVLAVRHAKKTNTLSRFDSVRGTNVAEEATSSLSSSARVQIEVMGQGCRLHGDTTAELTAPDEASFLDVKSLTSFTLASDGQVRISLSGVLGTDTHICTKLQIYTTLRGL